MFALLALMGVNVPIFVKKKKIFDGIIAGICTVICFCYRCNYIDVRIKRKENGRITVKN